MNAAGGGETAWLSTPSRRSHAIAIYFMHYNFVCIHQSQRIMPATAAKVADRLWDVADMVKALEDWEAGRAA